MNRKAIELLFTGMRPERLASWINEAEIADRSEKFCDIYRMNDCGIWKSISEEIGEYEMARAVAYSSRLEMFSTDDPLFVFERCCNQFVSFSSTSAIIQYVGIDKLVDEFINQFES